MTDERNQHGWAFWTTVTLLVLLIVYPLSFGPACWVASRVDWGNAFIEVAYQPLMRLWWQGRDPEFGSLLEPYADFGSAGDGWVFSATPGWYTARHVPTRLAIPVVN